MLWLSLKLISERLKSIVVDELKSKMNFSCSIKIFFSDPVHPICENFSKSSTVRAGTQLPDMCTFSKQSNSITIIMVIKVEVGMDS